jgi:type I restriction enzyme S subunit
MRDGWGEIELSQVLQLKNTKLGPHVDEPAIFAISKHEGVILASDFFGKRIASKNLDGYKILEPRDWVYSTIHIDEGSIATNHHPHSGVVSPMYTTMSWFSEDNSAGYFELLLRSPAAITIYGENAQGSINRRRSLPFARFSQLKFSVPPLYEQKRIVDLISTVDSYIEALRQQLESAKISRNAVLHELLTVGGEDWINSRLGDLVSYSIGGIWGEEPGGSEVDVPVYRQTEFNNSGILTTPAEAFRSVSTSQLRSRILQEGDVLIQKSAGTPSLPGRVAYVSNLDDEVATFSNFLSLLRPDQEKCLSRFAFLVFWTKHWTGRAFQHQRGTNIKNLHLTGYLQEPILLPPLHEQKRIVDVISSFDSLLVCLQQQIDRTMGVRSGLLSDLLSGKHEIPASYDQLIGAA